MGDIIYLAAAYGVFWLVSFILIYSMVARQKKLQQELDILEQLAQDEAVAGSG